MPATARTTPAALLSGLRSPRLQDLDSPGTSVIQLGMTLTCYQAAGLGTSMQQYR